MGHLLKCSWGIPRQKCAWRMPLIQSRVLDSLTETVGLASPRTSAHSFTYTAISADESPSRSHSGTMLFGNCLRTKLWTNSWNCCEIIAFGMNPENFTQVVASYIKKCFTWRISSHRRIWYRMLWYVNKLAAWGSYKIWCRVFSWEWCSKRNISTIEPKIVSLLSVTLVILAWRWAREYFWHTKQSHVSSIGR